MVNKDEYKRALSAISLAISV